MSRRVELVLLYASSSSIPLHLERMISSYLGPAPNMTLSETCTFGSIALLDWMWEASCTRASERTPWWSLTNFLCSDPHYYRYQFAESMKVAAKRGDLAVVGWLLEHFRGCVVPGEAVEDAADNGHLEVLKLLWDHDGGRSDRERNDAKKRKVVTRSGDVLAQRSPDNNEVCWDTHHAVHFAHFCLPEVVRWLHEHVPPKNDDKIAETIQAAVDRDDWELAKSLLPPGRCFLDYAAFSTNPIIIEWMLDCGYLQRDKYVAGCAIRDLAVRRENLPLMRRIADQHKLPDCLYWGDEWNAAIDEACEWGQLEVFQWLVEHPAGVRICQDLKRNERLIDFHAVLLQENPADVDFLQYLYEQGLFLEDTPGPVLLHAIKGGQPLAVLKWLLDHLPGSEQLPQYCVMDEAAASGRLEVLQYFQRVQLTQCSRSTFSYGGGQDADAPLWCTTKAMDAAAANGHLEVVKWLHVSRPEGCTVAAMDGAARNGHLEVVKWLHGNRSESCTEAAMDDAAANGHLKMLKWLRGNTNAGCTTAAMDRAALGGFLEVIKWLHANMSAGSTSDAMDNAASGGHLETLKWLHGNTSEGCTARAISSALRSRHFRVASWLHEHFRQHVPAKLQEWVDGDNSFEELLFCEEHFGDIFTSDFLQQLRAPGHRVVYAKGEVVRWVKEKYLSR